MSVCDEAGKPLFTDDDVPALMKKPFRAIMRIAEAAQEHNGLVDEGN